MKRVSPENSLAALLALSVSVSGYASAAADADGWQRFRAEYLDGDEAGYQQAVRRFATSQASISERAAPS